VRDQAAQRCIPVVDGEAVQDVNSPSTLFIDRLVSALTLAPIDVQDRYAIWTLDGWDAPGQEIGLSLPVIVLPSLAFLQGLSGLVRR
jgi:hypothetical protein